MTVCTRCGYSIAEQGVKFCPICGSAVSGAADSAGSGPTAPFPPRPELQPPAQRNGPPWEQRAVSGFSSGIVDTVKEVLFSPTNAFRSMKTSGGIQEPLVFGLLLGCLGGLVSLMWQTIFDMGMPLGQVGEKIAKLLSGTAGFAGGLILVPIAALISLFVGSAIFHVCLLLAGGPNKGYETTFRVVAYSYGSTCIFQVVPFCGAFIYLGWALVCYIIGLKEAHETTGGKAALAVLLPLLLCVCLCGGILALGALAAVPALEQFLKQFQR